MNFYQHLHQLKNFYEKSQILGTTHIYETVVDWAFRDKEIRRLKSKVYEDFYETHLPLRGQFKEKKEVKVKAQLYLKWKNY